LLRFQNKFYIFYIVGPAENLSIQLLRLSVRPYTLHIILSPRVTFLTVGQVASILEYHTIFSNIMLAHTISSFQRRARASTSDITQLAASVKRPSAMIKAVDFGQ
jgi:hypothetical protein